MKSIDRVEKEEKREVGSKRIRSSGRETEGR